MDESSQKPLFAAILRMLRPLVRILLMHGVPYGVFTDLAKTIYVDVADKEFRIKNRKQTDSRISVLTGLSRKEIKRVKQLPSPDDHLNNERYNRAARVIAAWRREPDFLNADGEPSPLSLEEGPDATFHELVKRFSGDVPSRAILDELLRVGAVERRKDGGISLLANAYIPETEDADKLHILGTDTALLISTISHNLQPNDVGPFFQRKVSYNNLPDEALPAFREISAVKAQSLLVNLDKWLARHDRDANPKAEGSGRNQAGLGIYYFEAPFTEEET